MWFIWRKSIIQFIISKENNSAIKKDGKNCLIYVLVITKNFDDNVEKDWQLKLKEVLHLLKALRLYAN